MLSFENSSYLFLTVLAVALLLLFKSVVTWKKKVARAVGDVELVESLIADYSAKRVRIKFLLMLSAIVIGIIALANLRQETGAKKQLRQGIDIVIALDVSNSMMSDDVKPSRLDKSKQYLNLLVEKLSENRIGLVLFAGEAFLQMPVTPDVGAAKLFISNANVNLVSLQGTVLTDALNVSNNAFNKAERKYKSIILVSDGEDHDEDAVAIARKIAGDGVVVNTVGVGTTEGGTIPTGTGNEVKKDADGNTVVSKINEQILIDIAAATGGVYQRLDNTEAAEATLARNFTTMEKKVISSIGSQNQLLSFSPILVAISLLLLMAEVFIPETKRIN